MPSRRAERQAFTVGKGLFPTYHPAVTMSFFLTAVCFAFCSMQPVYVTISFVMASAYLVFLRGWRILGRQLRWLAPLALFIALLNSLFYAAGATKIWSWGPFAITLEGCLYGVFMGIMLISVLIWFACYNEVMTDDRFTYLFGRAMPTTALVISMISRWVPTMATRGRVIYDAQESLIGARDTSRKARTARGMRMASVLVGLGMEDSIQTSDSMRARGYGVGKRTSYASYSWHPREKCALIALASLVVLNGVLMYVATVQFAYYPTVSPLRPWWGYAPYAIMLALPFLVEMEAIGR